MLTFWTFGLIEMILWQKAENLLPFRPSLCGCDTSFFIDRIELGMVSEYEVHPFGFRNRSDVLIPGIMQWDTFSKVFWTEVAYHASGKMWLAPS
jgi:hypothetical protein